MAQLDTTKELDFLLHETGKDSASLLALAVQEGIHILFKRQVTEAYINNRIDRLQAELLIGSLDIEQVDYAWRSVEKDIEWGLGSA